MLNEIGIINATVWWEVLKLIGLISLPLTLYLGWTKIGHRVGASFSWHMGRFITSGIGSVTLYNMKDRPLAIFDIYAVQDGISIPICTFPTPVILKGMETAIFKADQISKFRLGNKDFEWSFDGSSKEPSILISTSRKSLKCHRVFPASRLSFARIKKLRIVTTQTMRFNGLVYNESALYALTVLSNEKKWNTYFIGRAGDINWEEAPNRIPMTCLSSAQAVKQFLVQHVFKAGFKDFHVDDLHKR